MNGSLVVCIGVLIPVIRQRNDQPQLVLCCLIQHLPQRPCTLGYQRAGFANSFCMLLHGRLTRMSSVRPEHTVSSCDM